MTIQVTGKLTDSGGGYDAPNTEIKLATTQGFGSTLRTAELVVRTDNDASYDFGIAIGKHVIYVKYVNKYGRLKVAAYYYTSGGHAMFYGGNISESSSSITFERLGFDSGNQNRFSSSSISGTCYIVLVASLGSISQTIPEYGIIFKNSSGTVTFNSNYMPAIPRVCSSMPSPNLANLKSYNTGRVLVSGLSNSDKPMVPLQLYGRGGIKNYSTMCNTCLVYNTDGYVSARCSGYAWASPYSPTKYSIVFTNQPSIPILSASDYF